MTVVPRRLTAFGRSGLAHCGAQLHQRLVEGSRVDPLALVGFLCRRFNRLHSHSSALAALLLLLLLLLPFVSFLLLFLFGILSNHYSMLSTCSRTDTVVCYSN